MKRIRFTTTEQYESEGHNKGPIFQKGSVHEFEDAFADRWLRRHVAEEVDKRTPLSGTTVPTPSPGQDSPRDDLDELSLTKARKLAKDEAVEHARDATVEEIVAAIRAKRAPVIAGKDEDALNDLDDEALVATAIELGIEAETIGGGREATLAAVTAKLAESRAA